MFPPILISRSVSVPVQRQLLSLATSEAIDAELQKLAANLEKLHEDVKSHNTTHEPLSPSTGGALAQGPASLSPSSTSNTSASTTAVLGTSPTPGAGATSGDAKKDAAECAECKQLQDELWALQCTITMLKRRVRIRYAYAYGYALPSVLCSCFLFVH